MKSMKGVKMTPLTKLQIKSYVNEDIDRQKITDAVEWLESKGYLITNITNVAIYYLDGSMKPAVIKFYNIIGDR